MSMFYVGARCWEMLNADGSRHGVVYANSRDEAYSLMLFNLTHYCVYLGDEISRPVVVPPMAQWSPYS